jgi:hypothetical protein
LQHPVRQLAQESMPVAEIARIKVTIEGIRPPIWRRLEVPVEMSMAHLSDVILAAFGWSNSHLHEFEVGGRRIGMRDPDGDEPSLRGFEDETGVELADVLVGGARSLTYIYDFGDDWKHRLVVEEVHDADPGLAYPRCTAGRRSAPPEDCGGTWGYEHLLEVLADPGHEEYAELRERCPYFDPEEFARAAADEAVRNPPEYWE